VLEREVAEDGEEEVVGEAAQPVLHGSAAGARVRRVRFHVSRWCEVDLC
jgi:hypothetical protein